jgi:hypothetical protein
MSFIFGGGGGSSAPVESGSSVVTQREAPGVEARKLALYDEAAKLAATPVSSTWNTSCTCNSIRTTSISTSCNNRCWCTYSSGWY